MESHPLQAPTSNPGIPSAQTIIAIIDEDQVARLSTCEIVEQAGYGVETFNSGEDFLSSPMTPPAGCILLDLHFPGLEGVDALRAILEQGHSPPIIMITAHSGIAAAVEAMKLGVHDVIEKPYAADVLLSAIYTAVVRGEAIERAWTSHAGAVALVETLTPREREVLEGIIEGQQSKVIAHELGLSVRTVETYRGQLMIKLQVHSIGGAIRVATAAGLQSG